MKYALFFISALLLPALCFGKGHGGGHGHATASHGSAGHATFSNGGHSAGTAKRTAARTAPVLTNNSRNAYKSYPVVRNVGGTPVVGAHPVYRGYGEYGPNYYYGGYNPYYNSPFLFSPYYSMFSFGAGFAYSPHYNYNNPGGDNVTQMMQKMDGYAVYEHDTIGGLVSLRPGAVFIENIDSGKHYDYKFHYRQQGVEFLSVYNTDSTQLCLTRISQDPKKLWRIVHEGRLNLYDRNYSFIYRPEDIDYRTAMVVYNGQSISIGSISVARTKLHLVEFINKAYGTDLDPNKFSWKGLLIYLDKLD